MAVDVGGASSSSSAPLGDAQTRGRSGYPAKPMPMSDDLWDDDRPPEMPRTTETRGKLARGNAADKGLGKPASSTGSNKVSLGEDDGLGAPAVKKDSVKISLDDDAPEGATPASWTSSWRGPSSFLANALGMAPATTQPTSSNRSKISLGEEVASDAGPAAARKGSQGPSFANAFGMAPATGQSTASGRSKLSLGEEVPSDLGAPASSSGSRGPTGLGMAPATGQPTMSGRSKLSLGDEVPSDLGPPASAKSSRGKISLGEETPDGVGDFTGLGPPATKKDSL